MSFENLESHNLIKRLWRHRWTKVTLIYIVVYLYATAGFILIEGGNNPELELQDAIWWTFVTMTTVGYGDLFPETFEGRYFVAIPTMMVGIGIFGFIISELSATLVEIRSKKRRGMSHCNYQDHLVIVHCSNSDTVRKLLLEFKSDHHFEDTPVCIVDDELKELPQELAPFKVRFIKGNPTHEDTLERAGIKNARHAILLAKDKLAHTSDDINLATTLIIKSLNPKIRTVVEIIEPQKNAPLGLAGADSIICSADFSANLTIQELQDPGVKDIFYQLASNRVASQVYLTKLNTTQKKYRDLVMWGLDNKASVLGLIRSGEPILNPTGETQIESNDQAVIIAEQRPVSINL